MIMAYFLYNINLDKRILDLAELPSKARYSLEKLANGYVAVDKIYNIKGKQVWHNIIKAEDSSEATKKILKKHCRRIK
jgi:hypothetical protein